MRNLDISLISNLQSFQIPSVMLALALWLSSLSIGTSQESLNASDLPRDLSYSLVSDLNAGNLTQERASAIFASSYARNQLQFANRHIWTVKLLASQSADASVSLDSIDLTSLPDPWRVKMESQITQVKKDSELEIDTRWEKVRDRNLLSHRINRSAILIQTKNFLIEADGSAASIPDLVFECELTHAVLTKLCSLPAHRNPLWVRVVRNRAAYLKLLKRDVAQIGITSGYFDIDKNTVFCYVDKDTDTTSSLRHELTHLILTNSWAGDSARGYQTNADFWAFEAIATYIESMIVRPGINEVCCMVGGWESPRLQAARYRRLHDMSWIPFDDLRSLQQSEYQNPEDIQLRYSQSAGLAHYFMDHSPQTKSSFIRYLQSVHRGTPDASILEVVSDESLRKSYDAFLMADREAFQMYALQPPRKDLVFSRTAIQSEDLGFFPSSHRKLDWFDLSFTEIDGTWLESEDRWDAERLNVESTLISDRDLPNVAQIASLKELDLSHCEITDAGVVEVVKLKQLETLWLTGTKITDEAAQILRQMKILKFVEVSETATTPDAFKQWKSRQR